MPVPPRQQPSKLFNLRQWLTLDEAAKHLSTVFGEDVARSDILRFALDKRLTLSVDFVNHAAARKGHVVTLEQCPLNVCSNSTDVLALGVPWIRKKNVFQADIPNLEKEILDGLRNGQMYLAPDALAYGPDQFLVLEKDVVSIEGVWDLPLKGAEALDVEHLYQQETDGPEVTLTCLDGAFVERDGIVCQLRDDHDDNELARGSRAHGEKVERRIEADNLTSEQADELRQEYAAQRKQFLERRKSQSRAERTYPAGKLPGDAVYVVRTAALREFEQAVLGTKQDEKKLTIREESTLLNIIGGLLSLLLGKTPAGKPQSVFDSQASVIDALLVSHEGKPGISERTLQEKLAAAKRSLEQ